MRRRRKLRLGQKPFPTVSFLFILSVVAVSAYFSSRILATVYLVRGNFLSEQNREEEAIAAYRQALEIDPNFATVYHQLGQELSQLQEWDGAIAAYEQAIALNDQFAEAYWHLGKALYQQQKFSEALDADEKALELAPDLPLKAQDAETYQQLGKLYSDRGQWEQAIAAYRQAIEFAPEDAPTYNHLGVAFAQVGRWDEAVTAYRQAIHFNPLDINTYQNLGQALYEQEKFAEAVKTYRGVLELNPNNVKIYNQLGKALVQQGKLQEAIQVYWKAIHLEPYWAETFNNLGEALFKGGDVFQASVFYQQAIELDPKFADAYKNLCYALHQQKKYPEAVKQCQQALALDPNLTEVKFYIQEAQRWLTLQKNPQNSQLPENLPSIDEEPLLPLKRAVVKIIAKSKSGWGIGTGWLVKREGKRGWIVTNRHVVLKKNQKPSDVELGVEFYSQPSSIQVRKRQPAQLLDFTSAQDGLDLAVLEVTELPPDIQPLTMSPTEGILNAPIQVIGHPQTEGDWTVLRGEITGQFDRMLKLSAIFASGSSGSPVFDRQNQVVGVAVGIKFACDRDQAMEFAGIEVPLSCSLAFPIEAVREQLHGWGIF